MHSPSRVKKVRFVIDVTTLINWNRPPVGIVRTLYKVAEWFYKKAIDEEVAFIKFSDDKLKITELCNEEVSALFDKYRDLNNYSNSNSNKIKGNIITKISYINPDRTFKKKLLAYYKNYGILCLAMRFLCLIFPGNNYFQNLYIAFISKKNIESLRVNRHNYLKFIENNFFRKNDTLICLGLDWDYSDYKSLFFLRNKIGFRFVGIVYDLIPIAHPQFAATIDLPSRFFKHMYYMNHMADAILCISDYSKNALLDFRLKYSISKRTIIKAISIGECINNSMGSPDEKILKELPEEYLLYVSTIEARKNHLVLIKAYILAHQQNIDLPPLILVGMQGWGVAEFDRLYRNNEFLNEKIFICSDINDVTLNYLYEHALFCLFPSEVEGWGLGAAESLLHGKICLISEAAALREATRGLMPIIPTHDEKEWMLAINYYVSNKEERIRLEDTVRSNFLPRNWPSFCQDLYDLAKDVAA